MHDAVQPFLIDNADLRGAHVRLVQSWQGIAARRDDPPAVRRLLSGLEYRFTRDDLPHIFSEGDGTAPATDRKGHFDHE